VGVVIASQYDISVIYIVATYSKNIISVL